MSGMKRPAEGTADDEPDGKKINVTPMTSSLPQVRLGTIGSEEELKTKVEEFAKDRLKELLDAETKLRHEATENALKSETRLTESKVFYRIAKRWWSELNDEMNILCSVKNAVGFNFPSAAEVRSEMDAQAEKATQEEDIVRVYGIKMRQQTDFTSNIVKELVEKVPAETQFKELLKSHIDKNRELTAELEKVENDLEEKTELCEDMSLKCEQLTKRNSRLIGQISSRIKATGDQKKQEEAKEEPQFNEQRNDSELAQEINNLKKKNSELQTEIDRLQMLVMNPNESTILSSSVYQSLKSQFSVLYQQADILKRQAEDARQAHESMRTIFLKQLEQMELDELQCQDVIRQELVTAETNYQNLKKDYDKLAVEHQQNLKQHEQAAPINREMRQLINSLQSHNRQLKTEIIRYKKKVREYQADYDQQKSITELRKQKEEEAMEKMSAIEKELIMSPNANQINDRSVESLEVQLHQEKEKNVQLEAITSANHDQTHDSSDLKKQLAVLELRYHALCTVYCRRLSELPRELFVLDQERKKIESEHHGKLTVSNQKLADAKSQEEAILNEMDKTGQAFEEMQEQNLRLIQDVRDKDKAYFTLFQERIKISSLQQLQAKEKEVLENKITQLEAQLEAQNKVIRNLEEKDTLVSTNLKNLESELQLRQQALELHKRRSIELAQLCQDQKRKDFEKQNELSEVQKLIRGKNDQLEEWKMRVKQFSEKTKKREHMEATDMQTMVLMEEVDSYKKKLKCPICNVEEKDAILTKCFHVFCYKCLKTRYETRNRFFFKIFEV